MTADLAGPATPLDPPTVHLPVPRPASFAGGAPQPGMPPFHAPTGLPPARRPHGSAVLVGVAAAVVLGLGAALASIAGPLAGGGTFTLTGELALDGAGYGSGGCSGSGGYSDIGAGASVTVADASGTVVATGALDPGRNRAALLSLGF
jgi:hypothetical protein